MVEINVPDLLLSIGGCVGLASIWSQVYQNYKQKSARETSWSFIILYFIALILFTVGKAMADLHMAAFVDSLGLIAFFAIAIQKIKTPAT